MNYESNRYFTIYDFLVSHGQLLIRSSKGGVNEMNIDIIFFDVQYLQIPSSFRGIKVRSTVDKYDNITYNSIKSMVRNNTLFEIETGAEKYYLVASFFKVYENMLDFNETSLGVLDYRGREKEI